jgi:hypothetical protein
MNVRCEYQQQTELLYCTRPSFQHLHCVEQHVPSLEAVQRMVTSSQQ